MAGEIVSTASKAATVKDFMVKYHKHLEDALPVHLKKDWERYVRIAMGAMTRNPKLYECSPRSLFGAVLQCAQLGLEPDDVRGHAYLLPFGNEVVLVPGYKGLMDLARRSGEISYIKADVVYSKDIFTYSYGSGNRESYEHQPTTHMEPGELVYAYAKAHYKDNTEQFIVLNKRQVHERMNKSPSARSGRNSPWTTDPEAMWRKTAVRALATFLPSSAEDFHRAIGLEERAEAGISQGLADLAPMDEEPKKPQLDKLTEKMKEKPKRTAAKPAQPEVYESHKPKPANTAGNYDPEPPDAGPWPDGVTPQHTIDSATTMSVAEFIEEIAYYTKEQMKDANVLQGLLTRVSKDENTPAIVAWNNRRAAVVKEDSDAKE